MNLRALNLFYPLCPTTTKNYIYLFLRSLFDRSFSQIATGSMQAMSSST